MKPAMLFNALCLGIASRAAGEALVTPADRVKAANAVKTSISHCGNLQPLELHENAKEDLVAASGDNFVLQQMKGAKDSDEFTKNLENNIDFGFVAAKGGPFMASFLFFIGYCLCCWTACPCCACCRIRRKQRKVHACYKFVGCGLLVALVLGMLIAGALSRRGFITAVDGFRHTSCSGAKLLNTTLSGTGGTMPFLGLLPTLETFDALINEFNDGSNFNRDLGNIIDETKSIEDAVTLASGTLGLLKDMVAANANKRPKTPAGTDLLHDCTLCPHLETVLTDAITVLNDGVGSSLKDARGEVKAQLTGQSMKDLQASIKEATQPLNELKKLFIESFGFIVDSNDLPDAIDSMEQFGLIGCLALVMMALLVSCCACTGFGLWTCKELKKGGSEVEVGASGAPKGLQRGASFDAAQQRMAAMSKKYKGHVHRCSLCTWCCGCYTVLFGLFVGGLLTVLSVPLASICLILDDVNSQMLDDISGVLPTNFTGDSGEIMKDTIDQCFRNPNKNANPYLLDIIFTRNATTNQKITMRKTIVNDTKDMINAQFDGVTATMSTQSMTLNNDPNIIQLKNTLRDTRMDSMMAPEATYNWAGSPYANMAQDARSISAGKLSQYWTSTAGCSNFTVPAGMGRLAGQTVSGISTFSSSLAGLGTPIVNPTCGKKVTCASTSDTACAAGNAFMTLKQNLRTITNLKCRKFKTASGATCDVINMVQTTPGNYNNDCLKSDGTVEAKVYDCSLADFTTLVSTFETRLDKVFARLDAATSQSKDKINVDMKSLVDRTVIKRIEKIADGLTCGFLGKAYQGFIDGTCYAGVWGFTQISTSYVACASLTLVLVIMMYVVWRISVDNFNSTAKVANQ